MIEQSDRQFQKRSNCFDWTTSSIEIDSDLIDRFHVAACDGDVSTVKDLLEEGVPVDCIDEYDQTALFDATYYNRTDVIRLLLQNGANINKQNRRGYTPVHIAAMYNSTEVIVQLMKHGGSININNDNGDKPIDLARQYKSEAAVLMLEQL